MNGNARTGRQTDLQARSAGKNLRHHFSFECLKVGRENNMNDKSIFI